MSTPYREKLYLRSEFISAGDGAETRSKFPMKIRHLMDSVAEVACLSQRVAWDKQFPVEEKKISELLLWFTECRMPATGEVWVWKIYDSGDGFRMTIPHVEILNIVRDHNLIIAEAWIIRYGQNFWSIERKSLTNQRSRSRKHQLSDSVGTLTESSC